MGEPRNSDEIRRDLAKLRDSKPWSDVIHRDAHIRLLRDVPSLLAENERLRRTAELVIARLGKSEWVVSAELARMMNGAGDE